MVARVEFVMLNFVKEFDLVILTTDETHKDEY